MMYGPWDGEAPAPSRNSFRGNRCAGCGGELDLTNATGRPRREDHVPGCKFFDRALKVMRYAKELRQVASEPTGRGSDRQRYLQKNAEDLSAAACTGDPVRAVKRLAEKYKAECEKGAKQAEAAEMLMQACQALASCKDPAPITPAPG